MAKRTEIQYEQFLKLYQELPLNKQAIGMLSIANLTIEEYDNNRDEKPEFGELFVNMKMLNLVVSIVSKALAETKDDSEREYYLSNLINISLTQEKIMIAIKQQCEADDNVAESIAPLDEMIRGNTTQRAIKSYALKLVQDSLFTQEQKKLSGELEQISQRRAEIDAALNADEDVSDEMLEEMRSLNSKEAEKTQKLGEIFTNLESLKADLAADLVNIADLAELTDADLAELTGADTDADLTGVFNRLSLR